MMSQHLPTRSHECPLTIYLQCLEELCTCNEAMVAQLFSVQHYVIKDVWEASAHYWRDASDSRPLLCQQYDFMRGLEAHANFIDDQTRSTLDLAQQSAKVTVLKTSGRLARDLDHWWPHYWKAAS